jgi:DNA-directed RNA polymerase subunit beta
LAYSFTARKRIRKSFGKIEAVAEMPNLIDIQSKSYESFLQMNTPADARTDIGLSAALASVFPINDMAGTCTLEYIGYSFDKPKYDVEECRQRGINFSAP